MENIINKENKSVSVIIVLLNIFLQFTISIIANKTTETVTNRISTWTIIILFIVSFISINLLLTSGISYTNFFKRLKENIFQRRINIFWMTLIIGMFVARICHRFFSFNYYILTSFLSTEKMDISNCVDFKNSTLPIFYIYLWDYEIISYLILLFFVYLIIYIANHNTFTTFIASLGACVGVSSSLIIFANEENQIIFTLIISFILTLLYSILLTSKWLISCNKYIYKELTKKV